MRKVEWGTSHRPRRSLPKNHLSLSLETDELYDYSDYIAGLEPVDDDDWEWVENDHTFNSPGL